MITKQWESCYTCRLFHHRMKPILTLLVAVERDNVVTDTADKLQLGRRVNDPI